MKREEVEKSLQSAGECMDKARAAEHLDARNTFIRMAESHAAIGLLQMQLYCEAKHTPKKPGPKPKAQATDEE